MRRTLAGYCIGAILGVLALGGCGAWAGYFYGPEWFAAPAPPPWRAALIGAFGFVAYYGWLAVAIGGVIGAVAGLGSWLAKPRRSVEAEVASR